MLTIKLFLENSGRTLRLDKDFPVYQGQFNNILLNVFVPTDILAPYFTKYAKYDDTIISPYVAGTSVCVGSKTIKRNGTYEESKKYYLRFVKTLVKDGVSYALFERKLPKEFTTYAGENNIIVNVNNVEFGEIKSANATTTGTSLTIQRVDIGKVQEKLPAVSLNYTFIYNGTDWLLNGEVAVLASYGIFILGEPEYNDEILLRVYADKTSTTNITTTQPITMEVMASNQFDVEPAISASELETLQAYINELTELLSKKQDKQDNGLQTQIKTVVGAINELVHLVGTNERVIGTYNFIAETIEQLPTNEQMLEFVRSVMGATYELQGNEVVYTIKDYAGIKTTYKSIYSDDTNKWLFYEVTQIMSADNGVKGIVEGTYGLGYNYDTIVNISGGRIVDIAIKVDGKYVNIRDAFTTEKWVKDYCKNNYAPIQLSQQLYFSKKNEEYIISNEVVTSETSFEKVISETTLDIELLSASYTLPFEKLEISKDNKFRCCIYIMSNINTSMTFRLETKINTKTVNIQKSTYTTLEKNKLFKLEFESPFEELGNEKITTALNDKITVRLIATRNVSENPTFTVVSSTDYPSTYSLLLDTKAIIIGKIEQELGNSKNSVISQNATTKIVGNYLVMNITETSGYISKSNFEYLKEEFEYNGKKAQHRGIIAVNGTEKMEYKFEIEKDNKLYFIGSKIVGEVLTFYEMEIKEATEETYIWTISERKAGGTKVLPNGTNLNNVIPNTYSIGLYKGNQTLENLPSEIQGLESNFVMSLQQFYTYYIQQINFGDIMYFRKYDVPNKTWGNWHKADLDNVRPFDNTPTENSTNAVTSGGVFSALSTIKKNAFFKVNTTTYPTLNDFLASTGTEGYVYLYPIHTSDLSKGYYQYIWEDSTWLSIGTTLIDLTGYYTKTEANGKIFISSISEATQTVYYDLTNGIMLTSSATATKEDGTTDTYTEFNNIPIVTDGDLSMDVNADNTKVVITGAKALAITLATPSQTQGTITADQLGFLKAKDSNYIEINDNDGHIEKYYYSTEASEDGYRVYTHIEDEAGTPSIKSFTITESVRSWVIVETQIQSKLTLDETPTENSNNPVKSKGIKKYVDDNISIKTLSSATDLDTVIIGTTYKAGLYVSRVNFGTFPSFISGDNETYLLELEGFTPTGTLVTCTQTITMGKNVAWRTYTYETETWTTWTEKDLSKINTNQMKLLTENTDYTVTVSTNSYLGFNFIKAYKELIIRIKNSNGKCYGDSVGSFSAWSNTTSGDYDLTSNFIGAIGGGILGYIPNKTYNEIHLQARNNCFYLDSIHFDNIYIGREICQYKGMIKSTASEQIKIVNIYRNAGTIPNDNIIEIYGVEA